MQLPSTSLDDHASASTSVMAGNTEVDVPENIPPPSQESPTAPAPTPVNVPSIVDSITEEYIRNFQPVHIRYYDTRFCTRFSTEERNLDTCVRMHSNKVALVCLSPKHSIFQKGERIERLNFKIKNKVDRLANEVRGKGKRGAQVLAPESLLCHIETDKGNTYPVHAGLHGKLLEINAALVDNPNLMIDDANSDGFIAIVLQDLKRHQDNVKSLIPKADYYN